MFIQVTEIDGKVSRVKYYECALCNVKCGNIRTFREHVSGKKHKEAQAREEEKSETVDLEMDKMSGGGFMLAPFVREEVGEDADGGVIVVQGYKYQGVNI